MFGRAAWVGSLLLFVQRPALRGVVETQPVVRLLPFVQRLTSGLVLVLQMNNRNTGSRRTQRERAANRGEPTDHQTEPAGRTRAGSQPVRRDRKPLDEQERAPNRGAL